MTGHHWFQLETSSLFYSFINTLKTFTRRELVIIKAWWGPPSSIHHLLLFWQLVKISVASKTTFYGHAKMTGSSFISFSFRKHLTRNQFKDRGWGGRIWWTFRLEYWCRGPVIGVISLEVVRDSACYNGALYATPQRNHIRPNQNCPARWSLKWQTK